MACAARVAPEERAHPGLPAALIPKPGATREVAMLAKFHRTDTGSSPYLDKLLDQSGSKVGRHAFERLCQKCDREIVGSLFVLLSHKGPLRLEADPKEGRSEPVEVHLRPLDTQDALGGISLRQLRQIASRAKHLAAEIVRLRRTRLVRHLAAQGAFWPGDLLRASPIPIVPSAFQGILRLPDLAKEHGAQRRPEYTRVLKRIYAHIRERTGGWHDPLVADVLNALQPHPDSPATEVALKEWRKRHHLRG